MRWIVSSIRLADSRKLSKSTLFSTQFGCIRPLSSSVTADDMTWSQYFKTRRKLQLMQRLGGVPFIFLFLAAEGSLLTLPMFDPTQPVFGVDPMIMVGLSTIGGSIMSYLLGSSATGAVWRYFYPSEAGILDKVSYMIWLLEDRSM